MPLRKLANLITMTVQLIIQRLLVQKCGVMSYRTYTACIMYNTHIFGVQQTIFIQKSARRIESESVVPDSDSTYKKAWFDTKVIQRGHVFPILLPNAKVNGDPFEKWLPSWTFRWLTDFSKRATPCSVCVCQSCSFFPEMNDLLQLSAQLVNVP